jgi:hypothetical protein
MVSSHIAYVPFAELSAHQVRSTLLISVFVVSLYHQLHVIFVRRQNGLSWNDAIAGGTRLITGNVWLDAVLFVIVLAAVFGLFLLAVFHTW